MSSKKATKKKAKEEPAPAPNGAGVKAEKRDAPAATPAPLQASAADPRAVQSRRVLEIVGNSKADADDGRKYSPRTEGHIKQLFDVLDHFEYSRADIAALVKKANYDELQIQLAVANIIEDRAPTTTDDWGTVKTKKQQKEDKKAKEEEERREQERLDRQAEKKREEDKKQARLAYEAKRASKDSWKGENADGSASLPPDPAILFAGSKPKQQGGGASKDDLWDDDWKSGDWKWQSSDWKGGGEGGDWWEGDWEKVEKDKRGKKGGKGGSKDKGGKDKDRDKDDGELWDMPDKAAPNEGGLDQWSMGDIRAFEQKQGGAPPQEQAPVQVAAAPMRTVEEIEREHLGALQANTGHGNMGKARVDALFQAPADEQSPQHFEEKGGKGRGRGKGKGDGKADSKGKPGGKEDRDVDGDRRDRERRPERRKPEEVAGDDRDRIERLDRSDDPRKQAVEEAGDACTVRKHSSMGCAVVSMRDARVRQAILNSGLETMINGIRVQLKPHFDKETKVEIPTDMFVAWGRQVEIKTPLSERELVKHFDAKHQELTVGWRSEAEVKQREEAEARQRLVEQQQQQQQRLAAAEGQQRLLEERRQAEERARLQRETQAKYINGLQGQWAHAHAAGTAGAAPSAATAQDPRVAAAAAAAALGAASAAGTSAAGTAAQQHTQQAHAQAAAVQAAAAAASAAGLNAAAVAYNAQAASTQAGHTQAAQMTPAQMQWLQAMYAQQQGWQQQTAQQAAMRQQMQMQAAAAAQMQAAGGQQAQDYSNQLRQAQAYYAYQMQQRGTDAAAAYAQHGQYANQGAYAGYNAQAAAAAQAYGRGERI
eukprot:TRINITY_DN12207_c0_g1_i2.p1 TRINITY_DN12207_c0_g1~~TRINITY_DN12207_c0_g1_i2.p1  ORF type:complete len:824 (+),score=274.83 TRINITY_DN12207_c0_g1_i2:90-2561(+)